jgi:hypothetical protein
MLISDTDVCPREFGTVMPSSIRTYLDLLFIFIGSRAICQSDGYCFSSGNMERNCITCATSGGQFSRTLRGIERYISFSMQAMAC